jgi:type VI protein secretion system component VasK
MARNSILYTIFALVLSTAACLVVDTPILVESIWLERLTIRLITLAAMGLLGAYYWRIQRSRLRTETGPELEPA